MPQCSGHTPAHAFGEQVCATSKQDFGVTDVATALCRGYIAGLRTILFSIAPWHELDSCGQLCSLRFCSFRVAADAQVSIVPQFIPTGERALAWCCFEWRDRSSGCIAKINDRAAINPAYFDENSKRSQANLLLSIEPGCLRCNCLHSSGCRVSALQAGATFCRAWCPGT